MLRSVTVVLCSLVAWPVTSVAAGKGRINLVVTPVTETYCRADADVIWLAIGARAIFTNTDPARLLSLSKTRLTVDYVTAAKSLDDSLADKNVAKISLTSVLSTDETHHWTRDEFLVLKPWRPQEAEISFSLPIATPSGRGVDGLLHIATYYVVISVSGWSGSNELAAHVQQTFKNIGEIAGSVSSDPFKVTVRPPRLMNFCTGT